MKKMLITTLFFSVFMLCINVFAESDYVIPSGKSVGIRLYTDGLSVAGTEKITDLSGKSCSPGGDCGIERGDIIFSAADIPLNTIEDLSAAINKNPNGVVLQIKHNNEAKEVTVVPAEISPGNFKIGLWVRDSTAGIGTVTYYNPDNNSFAALGHAICDSDTGNILSVKSGNIQLCSDLTVTKSERGVPGELDGRFDGEEIGEIELNCTGGIYGKLNHSFITNGELMCTALRSEVQEGPAYIMSDVLGNGVQCHSVEIIKIKQNSTDTKGLVFKITDENLIQKTGGIVRGMSGAPIIQNNLLIGAVTHVFVNDPSRGYGIFIENMLLEAEKN